VGAARRDHRAAFGPSRVAGTAGVEALVIDLDGHIVV
jgi:hypothetical protein